MASTTSLGAISFKRSGCSTAARRGSVISVANEGQRPRQDRPARVAPTGWWTLASALALVSGALWLRSPDVRYLVVAAAATLVAAWLTRALAAGRRAWAYATVMALTGLCCTAAWAQGRMRAIERDWPAYRASLQRTGHEQLQRDLDRSAGALRALASRALEAPLPIPATFRALASVPQGVGERGVVLYHGDSTIAWAGRVYVPTDTLAAPLGVTRTAFYIALYATATRDGRRAVATEIVRAEPPADRIVDALNADVARRTGVHDFEFPLEASADGASFAYPASGPPLLLARALLPSQAEASLDALERVRFVGAVLLAIALACLVVSTWRRESRLVWRLTPLAAAIACVAALPFNSLSNSTFWFDPTVYFADVGGPFTASVGALALTGVLVVLALLLAMRGRPRIRSRGVAMAIIVASFTGGVWLLPALARGVAPPVGGVGSELWLGWEIALFAPAAALLVAAAAAGSSMLGRRRGLPAWAAPLLAVVAALATPMVLQAPGVWPPWYAVLWLLAVAALAFTRAHRGLVLSAATVAALGATAITWNAGVRGRVLLAERDVTNLDAIDPDVLQVLAHLADTLAAGPPPRTDAMLLQTYVRSDLSGSGFAVRLASWSPGGLPVAQVELAPFELSLSEEASVIGDARVRGVRQLRAIAAVPGTFLVLAVPHPGGWVSSVVVAPRTRLIRDNPYVALLGLAPRDTRDPPYRLSVTEAEPTAAATVDTRWYREENTLHGDRVLPTPRGAQRVHIDVELRSIWILAQRGLLVVMLDLLLISALWLLSTFPERAFGRWTRVRVRRGTRSYRARLTLALFAFFVLPELAFGLWSYERLRSEDRQSRDLLLQETLRSVSGYERPERLDVLGGRLQPPLLLFEGGALTASSINLYGAVAPIGRYLPASVQMGIGAAGEEYRSAVENVGDETALFGFRSSRDVGGNPIVLGAPARGNEQALDQRRSDLGVMVLFATVLGALGALWLSGVAARSLAEPIGRLREAALAIAAGEREPPLAGRSPPEEFAPVFSAFRRMASDLGESRAALESAQRRTAAVLRNVASGVIAIASDDTVTLANPRAEALVGRPLPPGALVAQLSPTLDGRVRRFLGSAADEEEFELTLDTRQVQARLTRLSGSGGAVLTLDDVTELARAQRVLAWGEMARQVAHEIKNPLTPIRLGVQHLKRARADGRGDFDDILDRNVARILSEIDRLDEIARGFSRYGTAPAERTQAIRTDVSAVVRDVVALERMAPDEVQWEMSGGDAPLYAMAHEDELREVLLNVLENARQARARRVQLRLVAPDGRVTIEVRDDGAGIPATVLPRIFEPHFSTRTSGSGLGLAISRQMVEGWGGEIGIASREGEGTTVRVALRAAEAQHPAAD